MTTPIDPKRSVRLSQISFFHICNWITTHMAEVTPGKTHAELCQLINETEELTEHTPNGGLGIHSISAIIRATGYTPAAPGARSKVERTKITKTHFNELKREVARIKQDMESIRAQIHARIDTITGDKRDWAALDEEDQATLEECDKIATSSLENRVEVFKEEEKFLKIRDDNDAQLDDTHPEDAPHQEDIKGEFDTDGDVHFQGFQPSPEIQALIMKGNREKSLVPVAEDTPKETPYEEESYEVPSDD